MNEQSKISDICTIFYLVFSVFWERREKIKKRSHMWTNYAGLSIPAGMYKDDVFPISSLQSFQSYAFEVPRVAIWSRRERVVAALGASVVMIIQMMFYFGTVFQWSCAAKD
jgi:hypothetical protein